MAAKMIRPKMPQFTPRGNPDLTISLAVHIAEVVVLRQKLAVYVLNLEEVIDLLIRRDRNAAVGVVANMIF